MVTDDCQVLIVGSGVGGLSLAGLLRNNGLEPIVVEQNDQSPDRRNVLEIGSQTLRLLNRIGVTTDICAAGTPVETWSLRTPNGTVRTRIEALDSLGFVAIKRPRFREIMSEVLPDAAIRCDTAFQSFDQSDGRITVEFTNGVREPFDAVVGADGAESRVREQLNESERIPYGTQNLTIMVDRPNGFEEATEIWAPDGTVLRTAPVGDQLAVRVTVPASRVGGDSDDPRAIIERVSDLDWLGSAALDRDDILRTWSTSDRRVETDRFADGRIALLGDAAHERHRLTGVEPLLTVEDTVVLSDVIARENGRISDRLDEYATRRHARITGLYSGIHGHGRSTESETHLADWRSAVLDTRRWWLASCFLNTTPDPPTA